MSDQTSTSEAAIAGKPSPKESWVGRVAEDGRTWVGQPGATLQGDGIWFLEDAGGTLVRRGQVITDGGPDPALYARYVQFSLMVDIE